MPRSVALKFDGGPLPAFNKEVSGMLQKSQEAAINLLCPEHSDRLYSSRGAGLMENALTGFIADQEGAIHAAKFAAAATLAFMKSIDAASAPGKLTLEPVRISGGKLSFSMSLESQDGLEKLESVIDI